MKVIADLDEFSLIAANDVELEFIYYSIKGRECDACEWRGQHRECEHNINHTSKCVELSRIIKKAITKRTRNTNRKQKEATDGSQD